MGEVVWTILAATAGGLMTLTLVGDEITENCMTYHEQMVHTEAVSTCNKIMYGSDK